MVDARDLRTSCSIGTVMETTEPPGVSVWWEGVGSAWATARPQATRMVLRIMLVVQMFLVRLALVGVS